MTRMTNHDLEEARKRLAAVFKDNRRQFCDEGLAVSAVITSHPEKLIELSVDCCGKGHSSFSSRRVHEQHKNYLEGVRNRIDNVIDFAQREMILCLSSDRMGQVVLFISDWRSGSFWQCMESFLTDLRRKFRNDGVLASSVRTVLEQLPVWQQLCGAAA